MARERKLGLLVPRHWVFAPLLILVGDLAFADPAVLRLAQASPGPEQVASAQQTTGLQEVVVTATRRAEDISKVPISVTALSQDQMDTIGAKDLTDVVKFSPGLNVDVGNAGSNSISIRGISSGAGAGTTGIYIDDTPIQIRNTGYNAGTAFPSLFDLERVEVLRGPQGTLFGAGSEGGTVRFILTQPSLTKFSTYARAEGSQVEHGGIGGEGGISVNGPIIQDRLGFLASAYYRKEPGYIDSAAGTYTILDRSGQSRGNAIDFISAGIRDRDSNWNRTLGFRAALKFAPTDSLTATASVVYQDRFWKNSSNSFLQAASDPSSGSFIGYGAYAGDPATNPRWQPPYGPDLQEAGDKFWMPALQVQWSLSAVDLIYDASYFHRNYYGWRDATPLYLQLFASASGTSVQQVGDHNGQYMPDTQRNITQELRLQSSDPNARLTWTTGVFFSRNKQTSQTLDGTNFIRSLSPFALFDIGGTTAGGPPFGPGSNGFENYFGYPILPHEITYIADFATTDEQTAFFAQADFKITPKLTFTAGVRVGRYKLDLDATYQGGENNIVAPFGFAGPCPDPNDCTPGQGSWAGEFPVTKTSSSNNSTTPKASLAYQANDENMIYGTVSKGFRPQGADLLVPGPYCQDALIENGFWDFNTGQSTQPQVYKPDSVWSYELGAKNRLFNGRVLLDTSVYRIKWSDIQTSIGLNCGYSMTFNAGAAVSQGADFAFQGQVVRGLTLGGTIGYNRALFSEDSTTPSGVALFKKDSAVPDVGSPLTYSLQGNYNLPIGEREYYAHVDWSHKTAERRAGETDPDSSNYNPLRFNTPAYSLTNVRLGTRFFDGSLDVSLFVNNLANDHTLLNSRYNNLRWLWLSDVVRPRTYGLTLVYRP